MLQVGVKAGRPDASKAALPPRKRLWKCWAGQRHPVSCQVFAGRIFFSRVVLFCFWRSCGSKGGEGKELRLLNALPVLNPEAAEPGRFDGGGGDV